MKSFRAHLAIGVVLWSAMLTLAAVEVEGSHRVQGTVGCDVLLRCDCSGRNVSRFVNWQITGKTAQVISYSKGDVKTEDAYQGRVQLFLIQDKDNCSMLLSNAMLADNGTYRCGFFRGRVYDYQDITLEVSAAVGSSPQGARDSQSVVVSSVSGVVPVAPAVAVAVGLVLVALVLVGVFVWRRRHPRRPTQPALEEMRHLS